MPPPSCYPSAVRWCAREKFVFSLFLIQSLNIFQLVSGQGRSGSEYSNVHDDYDYILDDTPPRGEVERLLKDYKQNQQLVRNLGNRYYQVVYPVQVRHREKIGVSTREVGNGYGKYGGPGRGINDPGFGSGGNQPRSQKHYRSTSLLIKAFQHKFRLDLELNTRLLAPNIRQKEFLKKGATSTSQQDVEHCYYHGTVKDFKGSEFIPGSMAALQTCNGVSGIVHLGNETFVIHPFYGGDLSSKHPHVIYEYADKLPQGCAVTHGYGESTRLAYGRRKKRTVSSYNASAEEADSHLLESFLKSNIGHFAINVTDKKAKRDIRGTRRFIELALVVDKAMFDKRPHAKRKDVIHDAIQVVNIADLVSKVENL